MREITMGQVRKGTFMKRVKKKQAKKNKITRNSGKKQNKLLTFCRRFFPQSCKLLYPPSPYNTLGGRGVPVEQIAIYLRQNMDGWLSSCFLSFDFNLPFLAEEGSGLPHLCVVEKEGQRKAFSFSFLSSAKMKKERKSYTRQRRILLKSKREKK